MIVLVIRGHPCMFLEHESRYHLQFITANIKTTGLTPNFLKGGYRMQLRYWMLHEQYASVVQFMLGDSHNVQQQNKA